MHLELNHNNTASSYNFQQLFTDYSLFSNLGYTLFSIYLPLKNISAQKWLQFNRMQPAYSNCAALGKIHINVCSDMRSLKMVTCKT